MLSRMAVVIGWLSSTSVTVYSSGGIITTAVSGSVSTGPTSIVGSITVVSVSSGSVTTMVVSVSSG